MGYRVRVLCRGILEQGHTVQRLLAKTHKIRADAVVDDAVFGEFGELARNLVDAIARRDDQRHHALKETNGQVRSIIHLKIRETNKQITCSIEWPVDEVTLEHARGQVERFQEVALGRRRQITLGHVHARIPLLRSMIVEYVLAILFDQTLQND